MAHANPNKRLFVKPKYGGAVGISTRASPFTAPTLCGLPGCGGRRLVARPLGAYDTAGDAPADVGPHERVEIAHADRPLRAVGEHVVGDAVRLRARTIAGELDELR